MTSFDQANKSSKWSVNEFDFFKFDKIQTLGHLNTIHQ